MKPTLLAIVGSVTPPGRLRSAVAGAVNRAAASARLVDLAEVRVAFADGRRPDELGDDTAALVAAVSDADAVVLATPVYRGTMTGALKNLLDQLPLEVLHGKPVGIVAMGATDHHFLGAESHLRDVLAWFGALVAPVAVYLTSADFEEGIPSPAAAAALDDLCSTALALARAVSAEAELGPPPLAARRI